ncbi:FKBP-type peptidyl-prolyl cis-trans isomerase [Mucilaginibacter sp. McL0603]|uniref:FKBP-type peptidyl-prolyl cis-trans isomerase n=1 Tax=Mucilaginibacter sp. McL0603 TaxID=3415670 RepID=UPI003CFBBC15
MSKWLLPILFICCIVVSCTKSDSGLANYKIQAAKDDKIVAGYIAANGLSGVAKKVSDTSGVYYIIGQQGQGNDLYTLSTLITVGFTCKTLIGQTLIEQTNEFHPSYTLGQTILGWQQALPKIKKGGTIRLLLPSRYAYGPYPQPNIGIDTANAILDFNIQVYNITN